MSKIPKQLAGWKAFAGRPIWFTAQLLRRGDEVTVGTETGDLHLKCDAWEMGALFGGAFVAVAHWAKSQSEAMPDEMRAQFWAGFQEFARKVPADVRDTATLIIDRSKHP